MSKNPHLRITWALFLTLAIGAAGWALPVGTVFTYQGQLMDGGAPADGIYDFVFRVHDDPAAGAVVAGPLPKDDILIRNGNLTIPLNFGPAVFTGDARWLSIEMRPDGAGAFIPLAPRQALTPTPYALYALDGAAGLILPYAGSVASTATAFSITNSGDGRAGAFEITDPANSVPALDVKTSGLGKAGRFEILNTANDSYAVHATTEGTGYAIYAYAKADLALRAYSESASEGAIMATADNDQATVIAAYSAGSDATGVYGSVNGPDATAVHGLAAHSDDGKNYGGYFEARGNQGRAVYAKIDHHGSGLKYAGYFECDSETGYGVYATVNGEYTNWAVRGEATGTGSGGGWFSAAAENQTAVLGYATAEGGDNNQNRGGYFIAAGDQGIGVHAKATGNQGTALVAHGGDDGYAAELYGNVKIYSSSTSDTIMELGEGLDYAEGFDVSNYRDVAPGSVLIIDPDQPGRLTLSTQPYDRKVAGIVAGARGLGSGVRLAADQYDHDVALAGRVYCNVDAVAAAVEPGDLLTTSDQPGFAMKVLDHTRAQGAILGKAMQKLEKGKTGQILVLVTLQ